MFRRFYLIAAVIGTIVPYWFLGTFIARHGFDFRLFAQQMWFTPIGRMFTVDLFISSFVFWAFVYSEGRRLAMKRLWLYPLLNLLVGLSLALPMFLYHRSGRSSVIPA
ncbi:MAG TPA: DUF2834 domain-containing protein [Promineifilum sp.]